MLLSDELVKYDTAFEQAVNKIADILSNLVRGQPDALVQDFLLVNDSKLCTLYLIFRSRKKVTKIYKYILRLISFLLETVDQYINTFQWNSMKYRTDKSLQETASMLTQVRGKK